MQVGADGRLPGAALAQGGGLGHDAPGEAEQQRPGQFDGRGGGAGGAADGDAVPPGGLEVDDRIAHAGGHQQFQAGQPGEEAGRERDAFAKGDHDVEVLERGGEFVLGGEVPGYGDDVDVTGDGRPVGHRRRDLLEVVQNGTAKLHLGSPGLVRVAVVAAPGLLATVIIPQRAGTVRGQAGRAAVAAWVMFFAMPPKTTAWKGETLHQYA